MAKYLAPSCPLEPHFIEMVAIRRHRFSKSIQTVRDQNLAMLCFETQFIFHLLKNSLAADRDRLRPTIVSSRDVSARSCCELFTMRLLKILEYHRNRESSSVLRDRRRDSV